jgi:hypothetical protein
MMAMQWCFQHGQRGLFDFFPTLAKARLRERKKIASSTIMIVTLDIPDVLAASLKRVQPSLPRAILEGFAVEEYRQGNLSAAEVRVLLGHDSRWETEDFLSAHDAWPGTTAEQVAEDGRKLNALLSR